MNTIEIYKALSDESRARLVNVLSLGQFNVQELTTILEISQSTISHHLKILQSVGVTRSEKEGTWAFYKLNIGSQSELSAQVVTQYVDLLKSPENGELLNTLLADHEAAKSVITRRREHTKRYFESVAGNWKELRKETGVDDSIMSEVLALIPEEAVLLELGCGSGALLEQILPRSGKTIGVDYSQAMLDEARKNLGERVKGADLRLGYLEHLPLGDMSVDMAVSYMVMHHLPQPTEAIKDIYRVLKPGGDLVIVDLVSHNNEQMRDRYADLWLGFDVNEFERWLTENGFRNIKRVMFGTNKEVFMLLANK